jgi:hypothetical protein
MTEAVSYSDVLHVRMTPELRLAIQAAAARAGCKPAQYVRDALWSIVTLEGDEAMPAIRADGKRLYTHLIGGAIVDGVYRHPTPDPAP